MNLSADQINDLRVWLVAMTMIMKVVLKPKTKYIWEQPDGRK